MKDNLKINYILILLLTLLLTGCHDDDGDNYQPPADVTTGCDSSNTVFNQLYNGVLNTAPNTEADFLDVPTHSYTFEVTSPATICKVGYRSQPTFESYPYLIEIYDNTTSTLVYSGNHTFLSTGTEYVSITPVALTVGDSYTIKRIQNNFTGNVHIYIGRLIKNPTSPYTLTFPQNYGILKITGTFSGPGADTYLPYIDIVFQ